MGILHYKIIWKTGRMNGFVGHYTSQNKRQVTGNSGELWYDIFNCNWVDARWQ